MRRNPAFIVCLILTLFFTVATFVATEVSYVYSLLSSTFLGGEERYLKSGNPDDYQYFTADYASKEEVLAAANALNETIVEEAITLLKNENGALPLAKQSKITVFGKNSTNIVKGGSGSNAGSAAASQTVDFCGSLEKSGGFICNPVIESFYMDNSKSGSGRPTTPNMGDILTGYATGETPVASYTSEVKASYKDYSDAAIVVISRIGGEGYDLPRTMFWDGKSYTNWKGSETIPGARANDDHYLQLDQNEADMIKEACDNFDKVIVVINSSSAMELGFLDDPTHYAYNEKIVGALWIGHPGLSGASALGKILCGDVVPSGRLADTYPRDFKQDPTWFNFGNNLVEDGNRYVTLNSDGSAKTRKGWFVEYREGIYTGYRYYETRAVEAAGDWYAKNVVYPMGYGMSYTDFTYSATAGADNTATLTQDGKLSFDVEVTNVGTEYAGKEVVQLYYTAPYTAGGIEKAHVVLGDFAKTEEIAAGGGKATVTLEIDIRDLASYDYSDANGNGFKGYEVEAGEYTFYISKSAHSWAEDDVISFTYTVPEGGFKYTTDDKTGHEVENLFDDVSGHIKEYLSRKDNFANFDCLKGASELEYRVASDEIISALTFKLNDKESDPWYTTEMPTQSAKTLTYEEAEVKLWELTGKSYDDPLWDKLLDQLTVTEMADMIARGNFKTMQIPGIDKPLTTDADGPMGFSLFMGDTAVYDTCYYATECVLAATWNVELAEKMGIMIGNEGLIGNEKGDGRPYSGWYAPATNLHRSQFGGRNFEYYSEDSYLSGMMASAVVKGAQSKGVYTYVKHLVLNEQETNRGVTGLVTFANEQAMREMYFEPFEMCVKDGGTTAMMSSFNRIGLTWTGGSYALLTELLRDEWGFRGTVITDFITTESYMNEDQMIRAGGDLSLCNYGPLADTTSPTGVAAMRQATKNVLYTVANSNAMNGMGDGVVWAYKDPWWQTSLYILCGVLAGLTLISAFTRKD
ncbi:MAG: glycoside hydrolase family 3 protein [Clostridia bacterium]|nr:glycoside hydrolase family 3 protein [Clostridia bacterium]